MKRLIAMLLVALAAMAFADEKRAKTLLLQKDGIAVNVGGRNGYSIKVDGIPFSTMSGLNVVDPAWQKRYYSYSDDHQRISGALTAGISAGTSITYQLRSERSDTVEGTQTLEVLPGRRLRVATDIRMTSDTPGVLENRVGSIGEAWLSNMEWSGELKDGRSTSGKAPRWSPGETPASAMLISDLKHVNFKTPRGDVGIETSGSAKISLIDYRRNAWAEGQKYYWLGILGYPLPQMDIVSYEVVFSFPPKAVHTDVKSTTIDMRSKLIHNQNVYEVTPPKDHIIPTPKQVTWGDGMLPVSPEIIVYTEASPVISAEVTQVVKHASERLEKTFGTSLKPGRKSSAMLHVKMGEDFGLPKWQNQEAYALSVSQSKVTIDCETTTGLRYALSTLEQLMRASNNGNTGLRRTTIFDYPSMPFRGIHFFTGKDSRELQTKMITEILAPLKINKLVYQVDYIKWDSQPQIHSELLGMEKADAKAVSVAAEEQGIDVIPLINTFGHCEWLLQRPSMRYLADDPNDPYAYDPSNPKVYEICEEIYLEAIALFQPTVMHIGHDEVHLDGFPKKPANQAVGATQLIIKDIKHYHGFLKKQGLRTMMWGDMFLGPGEAPDAALASSVEEANHRRGLLPKDIIITDWHYKSAAVEDYKCMAIFNEAGFDTIACSWNAPDNIVRLAKAAGLQRDTTDKMKGLLQTTWAGYSFDENSLVKNLDQYSAYVLAAEAAWTGGTTSSKNVPFDFHEEFLRRWNSESSSVKSKTGWQVPLDAVANTVVDVTELNLADGALSSLKPGAAQMGNYHFLLPEVKGRIGALSLAGAWGRSDGDEQSATIGLNINASEILLVLGAPVTVPDGTSVGSLLMTLDNGSTHGIALQYGSTIMSITDGRSTLLSPVIWKSANTSIGEGGAVIHMLRWTNPMPGTKVTSMELLANPTGPGIMLMGVSGICCLEKTDG